MWYKIIGGQAAAERYGAIMEQNGKFVEDEEGRVMKFDDPKNGLYKVTALRGRKRLLSVEVFAHPGETINIIFDLENKKTTVASDYVKRKVAPKVRASVVSEQRAVNKNTDSVPVERVPWQEIPMVSSGENMTRAKTSMLNNLIPIRGVLLSLSSKNARTAGLGL